MKHLLVALLLLTLCSCSLHFGEMCCPETRVVERVEYIGDINMGDCTEWDKGTFDALDNPTLDAIEKGEIATIPMDLHESIHWQDSITTIGECP